MGGEVLESFLLKDSMSSVFGLNQMNSSTPDVSIVSRPPMVSGVLRVWVITAAEAGIATAAPAKVRRLELRRLRMVLMIAEKYGFEFQPA